MDAVAWVHVRHDRLLVCRSRGRDVWYLPGGKREPGESDEEALRREVREELGVSLELEPLAFVTEVEAQAHGYAEGVRVRMRCYGGAALGEPVASAEIDELGWVSAADRAALAPACRLVLDHLLGSGRLCEARVMPADSLPVEHLFTLTANTSLSAMIRGGPLGGRVVVDASSGTFEGPAATGTVSGPGGDWVTLQPDGTMRLDVRLLLKTDDGADILMTYTGIGTDGGKTLRTTPTFQTGDERYAWLNTIQAVATGTTGTGTVTYEVYRLL